MHFKSANNIRLPKTSTYLDSLKGFSEINKEMNIQLTVCIYILLASTFSFHAICSQFWLLLIKISNKKLNFYTLYFYFIFLCFFPRQPPESPIISRKYVFLQLYSCFKHAFFRLLCVIFRAPCIEVKKQIP